MAFSPNAETVFADGPFGSPLQPSKPEIRALLTQYETAIDAYSSGAGSIAKSTRALLFADLAHAADVTAWVYADATVAYNGIYRKSGASGAGSWSLILPLPFSFIVASDVGDGTPNAILATTSIPVSSSALVMMNVFEANTASPVTVSFNGGSALTIKTNTGNDVAAGGLVAGMRLLGMISGSTFRLVSDQVSAAIIAASENFANIALAAANNNLAFATRALAGAANIDGSIHSIALKGNAAEGDGDGGLFRDTATGSPDTFTSNNGARTWYRVADIGFGRINIGAQPGPKSIEYFNSSLTRCSAGNHAVDFNALQAGLNSEYAVDIGGQKLEIEDTVVITKQESMLMSSITHQRNGSGDVRRAGNIRVEDDALPVLFDVQTYNARFDGIRINCLSTNTTTRHFNFSRPTNVSDIDASIKRCVFEYGLSVLRTYGRGMQVDDCEVVGTSDMAFELEWNPSWVSSGQSNDQNGTAQRAYTFTQIRQHGCKGLVKNVGTFKKQISDILISDIQGDTGGVIFEGVLKHSLINNIHSWVHPVSADQIILHGGSQYSTINNFNCGGFYQASPLVDRTPNRFFNIQPTDADPILGIVFSNGVTGPTNTSSRITGGGKCDITFDNVSFVDVGMIDSPNEWIFVAASGGTIADFQIRLKNCRFRAAQDASPPGTIVGGNQNALIKVYKDFMTTQDGVSAGWTAPSQTLITA
ncbi:hypothetical protein [Sinorhizobium medicae]|uniref:hypothetical protein n=1 Tax=Sinorhizobium medicae TaxID=110321 RepID=UPI001294F0E5|nr:hypothetical protein [Sinorhizobium medicae]MQX77514.1 hypothetical protein [Sinorhizobium medicae]